jgi:hypothetical protein
MYLRHDEGDSDFSSRNPMYDEVSYATVSLPESTSLSSPIGGAMGRRMKFPASWALPSLAISSCNFNVAPRGGIDIVYPRQFTVDIGRLDLSYRVPCYNSYSFIL